MGFANRNTHEVDLEGAILRTEGKFARVHGAVRGENPERDTRKRHLWDAGWLDADLRLSKLHFVFFIPGPGEHDVDYSDT